MVTKEMLIKFMQDWPDDTIVRISSWPFIGEITSVQIVPENGRASIGVEDWFMRDK